jgi:CheY-like chemotaxis protein
VAVCYDGPTALEKAREFRPEVALVDIGLPGMNGYDIARQLRVEHGPDLLLIAQTGYGEDSAQQTAKEAGFNFHLVKPINLERVRRLLAR